MESILDKVTIQAIHKKNGNENVIAEYNQWKLANKYETITA